MAKIRVRLKAHRNIYIHNDIGAVVFYFKNQVDKRIANSDRDGVGSEIIAGLTLLAFEVEARFNFVGAKLIPDWNERAPAMAKIEQVCSHLEVARDFSVRPYLSIAKLKDFRDTLAHGKPEDKYFDEEVEASVEDLEKMGILQPEWENYIDQGFFQEAYDDVERIWKELLAKSGLTIFDTLTHGGSQMSFIEHVDAG
jgi:antitoxin component HigA of HigAB toxin-antitoxin module